MTKTFEYAIIISIMNKPLPHIQNTNRPQIPFEMEGIDHTSQADRGWELRVNDELVEDVHKAELTHPNMGISVEYGKRPEGYDGFIIREQGGAATIPYMIDGTGAFYVGMVQEYRPTMGESVTQNIPRGFSDFGESKEDTAVRELGEETGYKALGSRMIKLAEGLNPNSTHFDFSRSKEDGVSIYAIEVKNAELELIHDDSGNVFYSFPETIRSQAQNDKAAERILGSVFVPLAEALKSRDMFTSAAAGQLVSYLLSQGEYIVPQVVRTSKK